MQNYEFENISRDSNKYRMISLLRSVEQNLRDADIAHGNISVGWDVHGFFTLHTLENRTLHIQGYPGLSTDEKALVFPRIMDTAKLIEIAETGEVSVGNEHAATVSLLPNIPGQQIFPYDGEEFTRDLIQGISSLPK